MASSVVVREAEKICDINPRVSPSIFVTAGVSNENKVGKLNYLFPA